MNRVTISEPYQGLVIVCCSNTIRLDINLFRHDKLNTFNVVWPKSHACFAKPSSQPWSSVLAWIRLYLSILIYSTKKLKIWRRLRQLILHHLLFTIAIEPWRVTCSDTSFIFGRFFQGADIMFKVLLMLHLFYADDRCPSCGKGGPYKKNKKILTPHLWKSLTPKDKTKP